MTKKSIIEKIRNKAGFICDMDGVIYHGDKILDGVIEFVSWLKDENKKFVFLTNSSERTIRELQGKLFRMGLDVGAEHFYTIIIGERMDTDIVAGIEAEIDTCLALSGISNKQTISEFAYRPHYVLQGVNEIVKDYK